MPRVWILLLGLLAISATTTALVRPAGNSNDHTIRIATWNMEWMVSPATAHAARLACRNGRRTTLPCDVAEDLARDSADLARIAAYARELDADIIAFQEVENEDIARRLFPGYQLCMADGPGMQHVGFAVRKHVAHRCGPMVESLSIRGRSRKAMSLLLTSAQGTPIELLAVHLKSGCSRDALESDNAACHLLQEQAAALSQWITERSNRQLPFIVLGDFNRVPPQTTDDTFWQPLLAQADLLASTLPFRNCQLGQPFTQYIDHMLISPNLKERVDPSTARHQIFRNADARYRLPDHCPVSISLMLAGSPSQPAR